MTNLKEELTEVIQNGKSIDYRSLAEEFMYGEAGDWKGESHWKTKEPYDETPEGLKDIDLERMEQNGGEDEGSDFYSVYKFTRGGETVYIKFQGWYASFVGAEYQGFSFVEPKKKEITVYE